MGSWATPLVGLGWPNHPHGTQIVKNFKLQMVTTHFEKFRMNEDDNFESFFYRISPLKCNSCPLENAKFFSS